ncbi:N-acetylmuramoyl-L-alanine amidase [Streptomyces microflavus]
MGFAGLGDVIAPVTPYLSALERRLRTGLAGLGDVLAPVVPDLTWFKARLRTDLAALPDGEVPITSDLSGFEPGLCADLADLSDFAVSITPDLWVFETRLRAGLAGLDSVEVPVRADMSPFDAQLLAGLLIAERPAPVDDEATVDGNRHFYGFECENLGDGLDPWPDAQLLAIGRVSAAVCRARWGAAVGGRARRHAPDDRSPLTRHRSAVAGPAGDCRASVAPGGAPSRAPSSGECSWWWSGPAPEVVEGRRAGLVLRCLAAALLADVGRHWLELCFAAGRRLVVLGRR